MLENGVHPAADALPPGPGLAPEDQARLWLDRPAALLEAGRRAHGDVFTLRLGGIGPMVIVADPEAVRDIFQAPPETYECRPFNESYRYAMGGGALFLQDGDAHRRLKRMMAPPFRAGALADHGAAIIGTTRAALAARPAGDALKLRPFLHDVTLGCLLRLVFGDRQAPRDQVADWFRTVVWTDLRAWKPWTRLSRLHPRLRALLAEEIALRRAAPPGAAPDLLSALLAARDADGAGLSDRDIQDQVLMLTITAGDAVATAAAWALWHAAADPAAQDALQAEGASLGDDPAALARAPRLTAFAQEVLRLHTVLPTVSGRRLTAPREVAGHVVPAGVTLAPCEHLVHRRDDLFEDAAAFRADRFLGRSYPPHHYFPFGGGTRSCLGAHLAPMTLKLVLATILADLRLSAATPEQPKVVRYGTLLAPDETLSLLAASR